MRGPRELVGLVDDEQADATYTVLQRQIVGDAPCWVSVAAGCTSLAQAERIAEGYKGWTWWGPAEQAKRIERGEEDVR